MRQATQVRQQGQGSKGAKAKGGGANSDLVVIFMILAQVVFATVHGGAHDNKVGGLCFFFCIDVLLSSRNLPARILTALS